MMNQKIVAGGYDPGFNLTFCGHVGKYETKPNNVFYMVYDRDPKVFACGLLEKSYENDVLFGLFSERKHVFQCIVDWTWFLDIDRLALPLGGERYEVSADDVTLYTGVEWK